MSVPGLQVSEITTAIDQLIKLVIKFKEAPKELKRIIKAIEHATGVLEQFKKTLEAYGDDLPPDESEFLRDKVAQYEDVLLQLQEFESKHWRLADRKWGGRGYWVLTEHFFKDKDSLEHDLSTVEGRIQTAILQSSWSQMLKLNRSNSLTVPAATRNSVHASLSQHASTHDFDAQQSSNVPASRRTPSRDDMVAELSSSPPAGSRSPGSFSTNSGRQPSLFSITSTRTSITEYSTADTQRPSRQSYGFDIPNTPRDKHVTLAGEEDGPSPASSPRPAQSPQPFITLDSPGPHHVNSQVEGDPNQVWRQVNFQPGSGSRSSTQSLSNFKLPECSPYAGSRAPTGQGDRPGALADSYIVRTLSRPAPPPAATTPRASLSSEKPYMTLYGQCRIWYSVSVPDKRGQRVEQRKHGIKDIEIKRSHDTGVVEILFRTDEGMKVRHQFPSDTSGIAQNVLRVPVPPEVAREDPRIKCWLMCRGNNSLSARTKSNTWKEFFPGSPEYSFTDEKGNCLFQSLITGCTLRSEDHVQSITLSSSKHPISENRYLQLWEKCTGLTLRYFCNGIQPNKFAEHNMSDVQRYLSTDESKKKGKWDREVNLKLVREPQPRGKSPPTLRIVFPSAAEKDTWLAKAGFMENG